MAGRTEIRVHAYALMDNHYHLVLETPKANLVAGMKWFQTTYTRRFNVKNGLWGHLFGGRYKAIVVQHQEGDYYKQLVAHLLMERTSVPQKWIVEKLAMGSAPYVSRLAKEMGQRIAGGDRAMKRMKKAIVARFIT